MLQFSYAYILLTLSSRITCPLFYTYTKPPFPQRLTQISLPWSFSRLLLPGVRFPLAKLYVYTHFAYIHFTSKHWEPIKCQSHIWKQKDKDGSDMVPPWSFTCVFLSCVYYKFLRIKTCFYILLVPLISKHMVCDLENNNKINFFISFLFLLVFLKLQVILI